MSWLGGIVGYFVLKDRHKKFAERLLIIGIAMTIAWTAVGALAGVYFVNYMLQYTESQTYQPGNYCGASAVFIQSAVYDAESQNITLDVFNYGNNTLTLLTYILFYNETGEMETILLPELTELEANTERTYEIVNMTFLPYKIALRSLYCGEVYDMAAVTGYNQ